MVKLIANSVLFALVLTGFSVMMPFSLSISRAALGSDITAAGQATAKTPLKKTNIMVLGDSLGDGVWAGLYQTFRKQKNIKVIRKSKPSTGFVRLDYYDWNAQLAKILSQARIDIAVVMIGANDRQTISTKKGRYRPGSKRWREIYATRVDAFIRQLKDHGAKVYWVGLPITRRKKFSRHMRLLNDIFAERAVANNITFVDIWKDFTTAKGRYSANGKDIKGRMRKLRANDGVHFTMRGYRKLALAAERYIRADLLTKTAAVKRVKFAEKQIRPVQRQAGPAFKSPSSVPVLKPAVKKIVNKTKTGTVMSRLFMVKPETGANGAIVSRRLAEKITTFEKPEPRVKLPEFIATAKFSPADSEPEMAESLTLALTAIAATRMPEPVQIRQEVKKQPIIIKVLPIFQPDADYLAKNLQKTEKTDAGRAIRQALANDFQDILSIVQPDKAVVVTSRAAAIAPDQEAQARKNMDLPQRQQMRKTVTVSLSSEGFLPSDKAMVAPREVGSVRPVSIESGTPDDNVEYASKVEYASETPDRYVAFTATSRFASITPVSGLDFATGSDAEENIPSLVYRTLLRGDALSPKTGRGDDFSWPRD